MNNLPKELTTVTTVSKLLAFVVFITLPFIGFFAGVRYQETIASQKVSPDLSAPSIIKDKIYENPKFNFSFMYPSTWSIKEPAGFGDLYIQLGLPGQEGTTWLHYIKNPKNLSRKELNKIKVSTSDEAGPDQGIYSESEVKITNKNNIDIFYIEDASCGASKCETYVIESQGNILVLNNIYTQDKTIVRSIVESFAFLSSVSPEKLS